MRKKRIIALLNAYSEGNSGADKAFIELFKRIQKRELLVVTSRLGKRLCLHASLLASYLVTSHEIRFNHVILLYAKRIIVALIKLWSFPPVDLIYATSDSPPDVLPAFMLKVRTQTKWVQKIFHLIPKERRISHLAQRASFFLIKKSADVIIVDNLELKSELIRMGFDRNRLHLNYLGVDHRFLNKLKPSGERSDGVFIGRIHRSKGIFDLVRIWKYVVETFPQAKLSIIGRSNDPQIELELHRQVKKALLAKNIQFHDYLDDQKAFSLLKAAKLFVFPSYEEGFGMALAEAMASNVPVIAYDLPAFQNTFKKAMITITPGDTHQFAKKIIDLLQSRPDRKKLIHKGTIISKQFDWDTVAEREQALIWKS